MSRKTVLVGVVAMAVLVVTAVVVLLVNQGGLFGGAQVGRIADHLPKETMFVAWTGKIETFVAMAEKVGVNSENLKEMSGDYRQAIDKLGFDPLSRSGLEQVGIDVSGPLGLALAPSVKADVLVMVYVPMGSGKSGVAEVRKLVETLAPGDLELGDAEENGSKVLWFRYSGDRGSGHARAGCIEVEDGMFFVLPGDYRSRFAAEIELELQTLVKALAGPAGDKLSSSPDFAAAIKGCENELLGAVFMPEPARQLLMGGDDELAALLPALADLSSAGAFVMEKDSGLHLTFTSVAKEGVAAYGTKRDVSALDYVAGQPIAGAHFAVDIGRVLTVFETAISSDKRMWRKYTRGMEEISEELKLAPGTKLDQVWNGELGYFMSEISENPEAIMNGILAFAGVADEQLVTRILDAVLYKSDGKMTKGTVGETTMYRVSEDGVTVAFMVYKGRLWVSGSVPALEDIANGKEAGTLGKDRLGKVSDVLRDKYNSLAAYADLEQILLRIPAMMSKRERKKAESVWPFLSQLDYASLQVAQDGRATVSTFSIYVKSGGFTEAVLKVAGTAFGMEMSKYSRKAKTSEAIDLLDKIYKGAADYYSTPRVSYDTAEKLDCQFPEPQGPTPAINCCASQGGPDADNDGKCDSDPNVWDTPTWSALKFQVYDPHYCVYSFETNGRTGPEAQFTATANCDLDCDGKLSTFQRYGKGDPSAYKGECAISGGAALFTQDELE